MLIIYTTKTTIVKAFTYEQGAESSLRCEPHESTKCLLTFLRLFFSSSKFVFILDWGAAEIMHQGKVPRLLLKCWVYFLDSYPSDIKLKICGWLSYSHLKPAGKRLGSKPSVMLHLDILTPGRRNVWASDSAKIMVTGKISSKVGYRSLSPFCKSVLRSSVSGS